MSASAPASLGDLPVWTAGEDPDFGLDFDAYAEGLFAAPYQGLLRTGGEDGTGFGADSGLVAYRNADLRALMANPALSNTPADLLSGPFEEATAGDGEPGFRKCFRHSVFTAQPPEHGPSKKLFAKQLTAGALERHRDTATSLVREKIRALAGREEIDLRKDFAEPVVAEFWSVVLGLSYEEVVHVSELAVRLQDANSFAVTAADRAEINRAGERFFEDFNALLRRGLDGGQVEFLRDLAADFAGMGEVGRPDCLEAHFGVSLLDGLHTLPAEVVAVALALWDSPDALAAVREDAALVPAACVEGTRLHPGVTTTQRCAVADFEYEGLEIPAGTLIMMLWLLGNRDPAVFDSPSEFRLDRVHRRDTTFGGGSYICPGRNIVRLFCEIALRELTRPEVAFSFTAPPRWSTASAIHEPLSAAARIELA